MDNASDQRRTKHVMEGKTSDEEDDERGQDDGNPVHHAHARTLHASYSFIDSSMHAGHRRGRRSQASVTLQLPASSG